MNNITEVQLEEVIEFSRITGTPVHELLGISEEKLKEFVEKHAVGSKPLVRFRVPSFEVEP